MVADWWDEFIEQREPVGWSAPEGTPKALTPQIVFIGPGSNALEVAVAAAAARPTADDVRKLWSLRQARRPSPLDPVRVPANGSAEASVPAGTSTHTTLMYQCRPSRVTENCLTVPRTGRCSFTLMQPTP